MHTVGRHALRVPDGSDGPPNVPLWMDRLATDLSDVAKDNQGTVGARPTSTALSPGIAGRYFATTDELDAGAARRRLYRDAGQAWDELATVPVSDRMVAANTLTEAKLANGATGLAKGSFSGYTTAGSVAATPAKVLFDAEEWDPSGWFSIAAGATQGRFTPQTAGLYRLSWLVTAGGILVADAYLKATVFKNGALYRGGPTVYQRGASLPAAAGGSAIVQANGTTDYFEVFVYQGSGGAIAFTGGAANTFFQGELVGRL